jgi:hypothetical protein
MTLFLALFSVIQLAFAAQQSLQAGRFFNPPNSPADLADNAFSENPVWTIGEVQTIQFTTTYLNYTIALWQQDLRQGAATLGPIIFRECSNH